MGNLLIVLGALLVGLIVMVKLAELSSQKKQNDNKEQKSNIQKLYRWIPALLIACLCIQLIAHLAGK